MLTTGISMRLRYLYVPQLDKELEVWIGENAKDNEKCIQLADEESLWFHLEDISSCHIILQTFGAAVNKSELQQIGELFSEYKGGLKKKYGVIYTEVKNVKLTKTRGTVIPSNTRRYTVK
jgi:predicted ribosome quality control (RQC) complex YloA/Tae2 family protein